MRAKVLVIASVLGVSLLQAAAGQDAAAPALVLTWKMAAPSPFARVESPTAVINGRVYLFGGFTGDLSASPEVDVYDPAQDAWTRKKDMPTGVTHLNPAIDGGTIWFAGGFKGKHPGPVTDEVWKYDIASDAWSAGPPLPERRAGGGLEIVGRKLHYFGGYLSDRDTGSADHWVLSLEGDSAWQRAANLLDPRGHLTSAALGGKIYALGGADGHDLKQIDVKTCHVYDPATDKWSAIASLPDGRSHTESSTLVHEGRILVVGGRCNSSSPPRNVVSDILEYDPARDRWSVLAAMPQALMAPSAAIVDGRLIVTCGGLNNPLPLEATTRIAVLPARR
jgi:N-acetylneuraminic acid mutarotase